MFKQLASLCKLEESAMKFEQAQISRKLAQATASHRKLAVKRGTSVHKLKTCDDLRSPASLTSAELKYFAITTYVRMYT